MTNVSTQIKEMLELQDSLNKKINPDWRSANYAWYRAIFHECSELMDHVGWKWWGAQVPDLGQIQLELVDIWHFGISILMVHGDDQLLLRDSNQDEFSDIHGYLYGGNQLPKHSRDYQLVAIEHFAASTLGNPSHFDYVKFFELCAAFGLTFTQLYKQYIGKNVLNKFRQDHGYKQGTYIKTWNAGVAEEAAEDNIYLARIVAELEPSDNFAVTVYSELESLYSNVQKDLVAAA